MPLVTLVAAGRMLGCSATTVRRRIVRGEFTGSQDNRRQWWVDLPEATATADSESPHETPELAVRLTLTEALLAEVRQQREEYREQLARLSQEHHEQLGQAMTANAELRRLLGNAQQQVSTAQQMLSIAQIPAPDTSVDMATAAPTMTATLPTDLGMTNTAITVQQVLQEAKHKGKGKGWTLRRIREAIMPRHT